jgi:CRISPR/Cas system endoribonuclease Cas6 (RAMP superfamily)
MTEQEKFYAASRLAGQRYGRYGRAWRTYAFVEGDTGLCHIGYANGVGHRITVGVGCDWQQALDSFHQVTGETK